MPHSVDTSAFRQFFSFWFKKITLAGFTLSVITSALIPIASMQMVWRTERVLTGNIDWSEIHVAIVFGAGVITEQQPGDILQARLNSALNLYEENKIEKLLVSGDNSSSNYNEPKTMKQYLVDNGVKPQDVIPDFGGRRTIDTCYRAAKVFHISRAALVTQGFHLPRSRFLCETYGIQTVGYRAPNISVRNYVYNMIREVPASMVSLWQSQTGYVPSVTASGRELDFRQLEFSQ
jgi:SanA protein